MKLLFSALSKFIFGLLFVGLLLFLPAWTFNYPNAWLFIALLFIPMLILGIVLFIKSPDLLKKRLNAKEKQATQKSVIGISALLFLIGFIIAGLDFRFNWSSVPKWLVITASIVLFISYLLYGEVMRENAYLSRTIEVQENQKVIDKGLYKIVRHPMYSVTIFLFLSIPLILGSWYSLICFIPYIPVIIVRIINEEKLLEKELEGYTDYKNRTKYRLIPFIW
jgi:protein-S-isoprenylcysteine O-methyltransferase Ste14